MTTDQIVKLVIQVMGGLAIFIFGMKLMSDGLHKVAGEKMRSLLKLFSANRFVAIISGCAVTAVIQSSSASTVMVIGFVNAGLLTLVQAIGIIFGANIGTTVTAQLVAFDISQIIMPSIIVGLLLTFISRDKVASWGETIIGLGLLFLGMKYMSGELKALSTQPAFAAAFQTFKCAPVNGFIPPLSLIGAIFIGVIATLILQSSSAATGIIIALGASGLLDIYTAIALVMGSNIGTTVTAQLAALTANRVARQAALAHTLFNTLGVIIISLSFLIVINNNPLFFQVIDWLSGADATLPRKIANAHTVFNLATTIILIPIIPFLAYLCEKIIPVDAKVKFTKLEKHLLETPAIALVQASSELRRMTKKAWKMIDIVLQIPLNNEEPEKSVLKKLDEREKQVDDMQGDITEYLSLLMHNQQLTTHQAEQIPALLHCTNDAERIGDHTAIIRKLLKEFKDDEGKLSGEAIDEFKTLYEVLAEQAKCTIDLLDSYSVEKQEMADKLRDRMVDLTAKYEKNHLKRVKSSKCMGASGVFFLEMLTEFKKISRHFGNVTDRASIFAKL